MKKTVLLVFCLLLTCFLAGGCIRFRAGVYPESYKPAFRGWIKGYATHKEMRAYNGTIVSLSTFNDARRPGELLSVDLWPLAGAGIGPIGARLRILPFGIGLGMLADDPSPQAAAGKREKKGGRKKQK